jgi:hypothetical protein
VFGISQKPPSLGASNKLEIPEADVEKTITFFEAFDRVRELHPSVGTKRTALEKMHGIRNDIIHYGSASDRAPRLRRHLPI